MVHADAMGSEESTPDTRVGLGTDVHRLALGRSLWVGGVLIPADRGAVGHSDADVVLHAVADALLGAVAAGDIGELFPDTDPSLEGLDSAIIVQAARERVVAAGYHVGNVDIVVDLERPKLRPHRDAIRQRVAGLLGLDVRRVSMKAKTAEGLGAVGSNEAIACQAVVLVSRTR
ncbi:MAG: 2-C-methyl-D-erythritol 2,4-cyclodiphosphate synthase [Planctomycetota bacterium]